MATLQWPMVWSRIITTRNRQSPGTPILDVKEREKTNGRQKEWASHQDLQMTLDMRVGQASMASLPHGSDKAAAMITTIRVLDCPPVKANFAQLVLNQINSILEYDIELITGKVDRQVGKKQAIAPYNAQRMWDGCFLVTLPSIAHIWHLFQQLQETHIRVGSYSLTMVVQNRSIDFSMLSLRSTERTRTSLEDIVKMGAGREWITAGARASSST